MGETFVLVKLIHSELWIADLRDVSALSPEAAGSSSKQLQVMDGAVVDGRKIIHTEFGRFADALKFALSLI